MVYLLSNWFSWLNYECHSTSLKHYHHSFTHLFRSFFFRFYRSISFNGSLYSTEAYCSIVLTLHLGVRRQTSYYQYSSLASGTSFFLPSEISFHEIDLRVWSWCSIEAYCSIFLTLRPGVRRKTSYSVSAASNIISWNCLKGLLVQHWSILSNCSALTSRRMSPNA